MYATSPYHNNTRALSWLCIIVTSAVFAYLAVSAIAQTGSKNKLHRPNQVMPGSVFTDNRVELVAKSIALTPGGYYKVSTDTIKAIASRNAYLDGKHLLPILPPDIQKESAHLEAASVTSGVPVNVLATLATIESSGLTGAHSGADAYGLMQVLTRYHL